MEILNPFNSNNCSNNICSNNGCSTLTDTNNSSVLHAHNIEREFNDVNYYSNFNVRSISNPILSRMYNQFPSMNNPNYSIAVGHSNYSGHYYQYPNGTSIIREAAPTMIPRNDTSASYDTSIPSQPNWTSQSHLSAVNFSPSLVQSPVQPSPEQKMDVVSSSTESTVEVQRIRYQRTLEVPDCTSTSSDEATRQIAREYFQAHSLPSRKSKRCECRRCGSGSTSTETIKKKQHACPTQDCSKAYGKTSHLRAHLRLQANLKPYCCQFPGCGKKFTRSDELQRHNRIHTGERNYICEICSKGFLRSDHLKKHKKTHRYNLKQLACPVPAMVSQEEVRNKER